MQTEKKMAICLNNQSYPASLVEGKAYEVLGDEKALRHGLLRIIDDSEEDYLYPCSLFALIEG